MNFATALLDAHEMGEADRLTEASGSWCTELPDLITGVLRRLFGA